MSWDETKKILLDEPQKISFSRNKVVAEGELTHRSGVTESFSIYHGWNLSASIECDQSWGRYNLWLFDYISQQNFDDKALGDVLESIQSEDLHWSWQNKSVNYLNDGYEWFYLYADNLPQGACLVYHPQQSELAESKIFYVEYLAAAPWNRSCLIRERDYLGVGSVLLRNVLKYAVNELGLSPGFSLHSLPQACAYYEKLNMTCLQEKQKDGLLYFELPINEAIKLMEAQ